MAALHDIVKKGSTDRSVTLRIIDSADGTPETGVVFNTAGIDLWYRREGAARTAITEATLAALTTAHTDGGVLHISDGEYRLDLPDAAFATGANHVDFGGTVTGMVVIGGRVRLVNYDPEDVVRLGLTALPNAAAEAAGGIYTRGSGVGQINQTTNGQADVRVAAMANDTVTAAAIADNAIDAGAIASDAITAAKVAADVSAEIADAVWDEARAGHVAAGSFGEGVASVQGNVTGSVASVSGNVGGNVTGSVGSVASGGITAASIATGAIDADAVAADAVAEIADGVWDEARSGHVAAGSFGEGVASVQGNVTGSVGSVATGGITSGSFAAGAVNAAAIAADAITDAKVAADVTIASVTGAVGSVTGNVGGNVVGSVASVTAGVTVTTNNDKTGYGLSAAAVQAIWDALTSALTTVGSIGKLLVDNVNATISSRATPAQVNTEADTALADVGLTTTITGRIDAAVSSRSSHSAADVWASVTRTLTNGAGIKKNTALAAFPFLMVDDTDGKTPETGLTITAQRSLDGAAFANCANSATEVSNGWYKITLAAGDLNGDTVVLRFSATGARTREIVIVTEP